MNLEQLNEIENRIKSLCNDPSDKDFFKWRSSVSLDLQQLLSVARKALKLEEALFEKQKLVESAILLLESYSYSYEEFQERKL